MPSTNDEVRPDDPVSRIMNTQIVAVDKGESLFTVVQELAAGQIGAVIVTSPGAPSGVISERDIVAFIADGADIGAIQAGEAMTSELVAARPEDSIASVGKLMHDAGVRHVPICDGDRLVGLVSMRDVLSVLMGEGAGYKQW
jgi:CBS domain-containing protein